MEGIRMDAWILHLDLVFLYQNGILLFVTISVPYTSSVDNLSPQI